MNIKLIDFRVSVSNILIVTIFVGQYFAQNSSLDGNKICDHLSRNCANSIDTVGVTGSTISPELDQSSSPNAITFAHCTSGLEFACISRLQCIPIEFVCDKQYDCQDQSDEIGCSTPSIISEPPRSLTGLEHGAINISCEANGLPKPTIYWTHNGSNLTARTSEISTSSVIQLGTSGVLLSNDTRDSPLMYYVMSTIQIIYLNQEDTGYWACHASNNQGNTSSSAETLLTIRQKASVCGDPPFFNDLATNKDECLKCYCSGVSDTCFSSNYYLSRLHLARRPRVVNILKTVMPDGYRDQSSISKKLYSQPIKYSSYYEVSDGYILPVYNTSLSQYYNEDRQSMLNNIHSNIYYYYKIEPNDFVESKGSGNSEYDSQSYLSHVANINSKDSSKDSFRQTKLLIRSYGGYIRFSFSFTVAVDDTMARRDEESIPWPGRLTGTTERTIIQGNKKEATSVFQDLADVILVCGDDQIIYHQFDIYSTSIVPNQNNHLSVPLMENYWQIGAISNSSSSNLNKNRHSTTKRPGSNYPTAPYNYNVNSLSLLRRENLISLNNKYSNDYNTSSNPGDHQIHPRSNFYEMNSTRHGSQILTDRDQFMHCLTDVKVIYIRAIYDLQQVSFNISSIYIDTAVGNSWNSIMGADLQAPLVEHCVCPSGYEGTSCEMCSNGYEKELPSSSRSFCQLKIRSHSTPTNAPSPHYSHYYNQSALILPNISINNNATLELTIEELPKQMETGNCSCTPNDVDSNCDPNTNQCKNCKTNSHGYSYCDISNNVDSQQSKYDSLFVEIDGPKNVSVFSGSMVKFKCTVKQNLSKINHNNYLITTNDNHSEITLVWSRLFKPSPQYTSRSSVVTQIPDGSELRLDNVTLEDSGLYVCELGQNASNIQSNSTGSKDPRKDFVNLLVKDTDDDDDDSSDEDLSDYDDGEKISPSSPNSAETIVSGDLDDSSKDSYNVSQFLLGSSSHAPNIRIIPDYSEAPLGGFLQLICLGESDQPDVLQVEWSHLSQNQTSALDGQKVSNDRPENFQLPSNINIQQNTLTIDSIDELHAGIYICRASNRFNMTTEATARLIIVPPEDTPPQVFIEPENLSGRINDSIEIKCFASGHPGPKLSWVKVDLPSNSNNNRSNTLDVSKLFTTEQIPANEIHIYKEQLLITDHILVGGSSNPQSQHRRRKMTITSMSILQIDSLKVAHSGQYICRANNNKGSNQASVNIDVDYQLEPTIVVSPVELVVRLVKGLELANIKFECQVLDGRPLPKISWFKISTSGGNSLKNTKNAQDRSIGFKIAELSNLSHSMPILSNITSSNINNVEIQELHNQDGHLSILNFKRVSIKEEGTYACIGENNLGRHSMIVNLQVIVPATIKILQTNPIDVNEDDSFQLECIISGHPLPVDIEWNKRNKGSYFSFISKQNPQEEQERAVLRFDRINIKDSGEYSCQARNVVDDSIIEDDIIINVSPKSSFPDQSTTNASDSLERSRLAPQLFTRPSKVLTMLGSNITIDCLAMSGRQPILIEWNHPIHLDTSSTTVARFYEQELPVRTSGGDQDLQVPMMSSIQQFGSKLRLYNVSQSHEGIYQCIGQNKNGHDRATAEIRIMLPKSSGNSSKANMNTDLGSISSQAPTRPELAPSDNSTSTTITGKQANDSVMMQAKTQLAVIGSNIELTCRVEGVADPAISWSREGEQLPILSIQIGHNLWIQNVTKNDTGRYICSARSTSPNKIIQDDVTLIVRDSISHLPPGRQPSHNWSVSIVPSKPYVKIGDSITLECLIKIQKTNTKNSTNQDLDFIVDVDGNIKREIGAGLGPVVWTNSNTGQSWFQDNVYIQDNLLIIYDLKVENTAIYRCNHNDINQHTDYSLIVLENDEEIERHIAKKSKNPSYSPPIIQTSSTSSDTTPSTTTTTTEATVIANDNIHLSKFRRALIKRVPIDSRVVLNCPFESAKARIADIQSTYDDEMMIMRDSNQFRDIDQKDVVHYWWTRGPRGARLTLDQPYTINTVNTMDADSYICQGLFTNDGGKLERFYFIPIILAVDRLIARFVQNPVSFIALPTITGAYFQLKIEMRFLPEHDSGLILYNGQYKTSGDFISLGLNRGHLEFRFELGDGLTLLRSHLPLTMNQWHSVIIERDRRAATMLVDQQAIVSNTSTGKFYNLDLDSLLYIGGHQYYYDRYQANNLASRQLNRRAISNDKPIIIDNVESRRKRSSSTSITSGTNNGSASNKLRTKFYGFNQGFHGCISHLRVSNQDINLTTKDRAVSIGIYECHHSQCHGSSCNSSNSFCQHEDFKPAIKDVDSDRTIQLVQPQLRCICFPGYSGPDCSNKSRDQQDLCHTREAKWHCNHPHGRCVSNRPKLLEDGVNTDGHECRCRIGFMGKECEDRITSYPTANFKKSLELNFDSSTSSWLAIQQTPTATAIFKLKIQVKLRPSMKLIGKDSIIIYSGQSSSGVGDHIMLCLRQDGHVEFNFDTGSGVTTIRSQNQIIANNTSSITTTTTTEQYNPWTTIIVERGLNEANLQIDDNPVIVRQLLEPAGQQHSIHTQQQSSQGQYLNRSALNIGLPFYFGDLDRHSNLRLPSYAQHFHSFDGCLSQIVINDYDYDLSTLINRVIFYNRTSLETKNIENNDYGIEDDLAFADLPSWFLDSSNIKLCNQDYKTVKVVDSKRQQAQDTSISTSLSQSQKINTTKPIQSSITPSAQNEASNSLSTTTTSKNIFCDVLSPCANGATCQPTGTAAYKCHCPIGMMGDNCSMQAIYTPETTVQFNQNAYVSLRFASLDELSSRQQITNSNPTVTPSSQDTSISNIQSQLSSTSLSGLNLTTLAKQLSMTEQQTISFTLVTTANYGIIFYHGRTIDPPVNAKSALTSDYIAIALVDGYIELSYELGSGVALIRSAIKVNDDNYHKIAVTRNGRFATLNIDNIYTQEGVSAGRLSMLNALGDVYLGGLPNASKVTNNRYMTGFQGCLLDLELNHHGPINLVKSDLLVQITSGRNVSPCMRKSKIHASATPSSDEAEESDS